jgi:hypothetical protein
MGDYLYIARNRQTKKTLKVIAAIKIADNDACLPDY